MKAKTVSMQETVLEQAQDEPIGMQNLPELPVTAAELEELLTRIGADVTHPVKQDPVAHLNGKFMGFWTS